jgi:exodeoxyribonuclease-1
MAQTYFFYDLETTGLSGRSDRVMQFAGLRTDMDLKPIGEPINVFVALNDDTLPSPDALLVTGITPQQTVADGYTEAQFAQMLLDDVFTEDTIAVGYNNIRFDDEFVRHLFWRTFRDPYEWAWRDGRSRWDVLDVVRMTRALRPDGINWPEIDGKAVNKLELLTKVNDITHLKAHDAMSDVEALIAVAKLIKEKQPQLYDFLLKMRDKKEIKKLVNLDSKQPFVYTSGRYHADFHKTTVAFPLTAGKNGNVVVYDLRVDPTQFIDMSSKELAKKLYATWEERQADDFVGLPAKELQYNRAPAVAPLAVLEKEEGWGRIGLTKEVVEKHRAILLAAPHFAENIRGLFENKPEYKKSPNAEDQLYDGFLNDADRLRVQSIAAANEATLSDMHPEFQDDRLAPLLLHYKARNYPRTLSADETAAWESWRVGRIQEQLPGYMKSLQRLAKQSAGQRMTEQQQFILQELQLWLESIAPSDTSDPSSPD